MKTAQQLDWREFGMSRKSDVYLAASVDFLSSWRSWNSPAHFVARGKTLLVMAQRVSFRNQRISGWFGLEKTWGSFYSNPPAMGTRSSTRSGYSKPHLTWPWAFPWVEHVIYLKGRFGLAGQQTWKLGRPSRTKTERLRSELLWIQNCGRYQTFLLKLPGGLILIESHRVCNNTLILVDDNKDPLICMLRARGECLGIY